MAVGDFGNDGAALLFKRAVDLVVLIRAVNRPVGGNLEDVELIDVEELVGLRHSRAGHSRKLLVKAEVVLEGDGGERLVLGLDLDVLLGLKRLVQALRIAPALHHATCELVDDDDLAALHDVVAVAHEKPVRFERLIGVMHNRHAFDVVERVALEQIPLVQHLLQSLVAELGKRHLALLLVDLHEPLALDLFLELLLGVGGLQLLLNLGVLGNQMLYQLVNGDVELGAILDRAGDDERCARLIDQDRVNLVDDGIDVPPLHHLLGAHLHVVAQIVKSKLVVGAVSDVAAVLLTPLIVIELVHDAADGEPQELVDAPHPLCVALGEVVVDRDDVDAVAGERIEIDRQCRYQRLALPGLHFRDLALVLNHAADQLNVEVPLAKRALGRFANGGESGHEQILQRGPVGQLLAKVLGAGPQLGVGQLLKLPLQRVDGLDIGAVGPKPAIVRRSEDLGRKRADGQHAKVSSQIQVHCTPGTRHSRVLAFPGTGSPGTGTPAKLHFRYTAQARAAIRSPVTRSPVTRSPVTRSPLTRSPVATAVPQA